MNGQRVEVFASGAFAGRMRLSKGRNVLTIKATRSLDGKSAEKKLTLNRKAAFKVSAQTPLVFDFDYPVLPIGRVWLSAGDIVNVRFKASPGAKATFKVGDGESVTQMSESDGVLAGIYEGSYRIDAYDVLEKAKIRCFLSSKTNDPIEADLPDASVTSIDQKNISYYIARGPSADLYTGSDLDNPFCFAADKCKLEFAGRVGDALKFKIAPGVHAWGKSKEFADRGLDSFKPEAKLMNFSTSSDENQTVLNFNTMSPCVWSIEETPDLKKITLRLFGCQLNSFWHPDEAEDSVVSRIEPIQTADGIVDVSIYLKQASVWGFESKYVGNLLQIKLRKNPKAAKLSGLKIILDPGHGGANTARLVRLV